MRHVLGFLTAGTLLLGGCTDSGSGRDGTDAPPRGRSSEAVPVSPAEVERAIDAFADRREGRFSVVATVGPGDPITHDGAYVLGRGYRSEIWMPDPDGEPIGTTVVAARRESWFSIELDGERTCWMHGTMSDMRELGTAQGTGNTLGVPPVVFVVSTLEADAQGRVTSDLHSVLAMVSGHLPRELGLGAGRTDRVEVVLELVDGEIATVSADGSQLLDAIADAGLDAGPLDAATDELSVTAALGEANEPVDISPPPARFTVELSAGAQQFKTDRRECDARLAGSS